MIIVAIVLLVALLIVVCTRFPPCKAMTTATARRALFSPR